MVNHKWYSFQGDTEVLNFEIPTGLNFTALVRENTAKVYDVTRTWGPHVQACALATEAVLYSLTANL